MSNTKTRAMTIISMFSFAQSDLCIYLCQQTFTSQTPPTHAHFLCSFSSRYPPQLFPATNPSQDWPLLAQFQIISYDSSRGGVTVILEKGDLTTSTLLIQKARPSDSGRYDCNPSNADSANITVHVLYGEHQAAMQHGGQSAYTNSSLGIILFLLGLLTALHATLK
ncbi:hypothetical protein E2C01_011240 [Portunus trituberculatus]|uniref:Ig-like domain-containing protein n=1 Tax=Portunus trituberculatus TaxID=210409 RepID=A0A5B7DAK3_PORTR|nr:hypothetical protein [Portunus trituberculatus]